MSEINRSAINIGSKSKVENIAGRDLNIQHYYNQFTPEFITPSLSVYEKCNYVIPINAPFLTELILKEKFVVLGGDGYNKLDFARYLAWKLLTHYKENNDTIEIKEWANTGNPQNFASHLQKYRKPTVFLLPQFSPHHTKNNLSGLYRITRDYPHYLIITTDDTLENWKIEKDMKPLFWLPSDSIYDPENLLNILLKRLSDAIQELPGELRINIIEPNGFLIGDLSLQEIAIKLKTPESIDTFVKCLTSLKSPLKDEDIIELLNTSQNDRQAIKRWFFGSLSLREKLITMGLCLFDGFYDDQFFAAMEDLFEKSWRKRNPSIDAFDYCDLDNLSNYFKFIEFQDERKSKKIKSVLVGQQRILLEFAWESHRRQILSALPVMENLVIESVLTGLKKTELYGTDERQNHLREIISETLYNIGLISLDSVKDTFLRLAARKELDIQVVVARAMALRRRDHKNDKELFDTLHSWQFNTSIRQIFANYLDNKNTENEEQEKPLTYIKATIALTVGFAATYDDSNQLDARLIDLLKKLADDTENPFIFSRFCKYTLPLVVRAHAFQLRNTLLDMTYYTWLNEPIGFSLALAYQESPFEVQEILDSWNSKYQPHFSQNSSSNEIYFRDAVMATLAFTYGWLKYNDDIGPLTFDDGFRYLHCLLQKEINLYVRKATIKSIINQIGFNFEKTEAHIKSLFSNMYPDEVEQIVTKLVKKHLEQRSKLDHGDDYFEWDGALYNVWASREQPLSGVEKIIRVWLKDSDNPKTQQVALMFMTTKELVDFQMEEKRFIEKLLIENEEEEIKKIQEEEVSPLPSFDSDDNYSKFVIWFSSRLVSLREKEYTEVIQGLLPEALKQDFSKRPILDFVFEKLKTDPDDEIRKIAEKLDWAISIARKLKLFAFGIILLLVIIGYLILK